MTSDTTGKPTLPDDSQGYHIGGSYHLFVDESSTPELLQDNYYLICGLILADSELRKAEEAASEIVVKHAGQGELKSSRIGSKIDRRRSVLNDINQQFPFYALAVDKSRLSKDGGLKWKSSSYKYLHKLFYTRIRGTANRIIVLADRYGCPEYMESFEPYMRRNRLIFDTFDFDNSRNVPLLQIADVIAGSIRRFFDGEDKENVLTALGYPSCPIERWPPSIVKVCRGVANESDRQIAAFGVKQARSFVEANIGSYSKDKRLQSQAIRYLLYRFEQNPETYVHRREIAQHLFDTEGVRLDDHPLTNKILAPARDAGILICDTENGVKLPFGMQDICRWLERIDSQVMPRLRRLKRAQNDVLLSTRSRLDILSAVGHTDLGLLLERL